MKTVKQVSDLTGISVRSLHYYDEIGLLKPSETTEAGYRLYDDEALKTLQQILFFKELDIPLKLVKEIMTNPYFNKFQALKNQKKLLILKRDRLNDLIELINKTIKGDNIMSFKEFDMSEFFNILEDFKRSYAEELAKDGGDVDKEIDKYEKSIELLKSCEPELMESGIKRYGSMEKFIEATKKNYAIHKSNMKNKNSYSKEALGASISKEDELNKKLTTDLSKDPSSKEIQTIIKDIVKLYEVRWKILNIDKVDKGPNWWGFVADSFFEPDGIKAIDSKYGTGSSNFMGEAFKYYSENNK